MSSGYSENNQVFRESRIYNLKSTKAWQTLFKEHSTKYVNGWNLEQVQINSGTFSSYLFFGWKQSKGAWFIQKDLLNLWIETITLNHTIDKCKEYNN